MKRKNNFLVIGKFILFKKKKNHKKINQGEEWSCSFLENKTDLLIELKLNSKNRVSFYFLNDLMKRKNIS